MSVKNKDDKTRVLLANITWNPSRWRSVCTADPRAGHSYTKKYPGHESLNFNFDKRGIDKDGLIHGYVHLNKRPAKFCDSGGIIIFYTTNLDKRTGGRGEIVGIYGNAQIIDPPIWYTFDGFQKNTGIANIRAEEDYSMLFPRPLDAKKYGVRVGQSIFYNKDDAFAKKIILGELNELSKNGIMENELFKLKNIYECFFGCIPKKLGKLNPNKLHTNNDESEQDKLIKIFKNKSKQELLNELKSDSYGPNETITINGKRYKRDNANISRIKLLKGSACEICGKIIIKKDGSEYVEAHHITPKFDGGKETRSNIILLCPNHHKELHIGDSEILRRTDSMVKIRIGKDRFTIPLEIVIEK